MRKIWAAGLCVMILGALLTGCSGDRRKPDMDITVPLKNDSILPVTKETLGAVHTPVYATVFGDTVLLSTYPVEEWEDFEEPDCPVREISKGGQIRCGGEHENEVPITRVLILDVLAPDSTREWFSGMSRLDYIEGMEKLDPQFVTDMKDMFRGCDSLEERPAWYKETEDAA